MNQRERMLATIVGALLIIAVGAYAWDWVSRQFRQRHGVISALESQIEERELLERRGQRAETRIRAYQQRSLPGEREMALSLYQEWLLDLVDDVGLADPNVDGQPPRPQGDVYWQLVFRVGGTGTLDQFTDLLFRFYSVNHLHRIAHMVFKPNRDSNEFTVDMRVEALVVQGAEDRGTLRTGPSDRLAMSDRADYAEAVISRNMFGPANVAPRLRRIGNRNATRGETFRYSIQATDPDQGDKLTFRLVDVAQDGAEITSSGRFRWRPDELGTFEFTVEVTDDAEVDSETFEITVVEPRPVEQDESDAEFTYITAITDGERRLVWLLHRTSGKRFKLEEGDRFTAGDLHGSVGKIGLREAQVVLGDRTLRVRVGKSLSQGYEVPGTGTGAAVDRETSRVGG